MDGLTLSYMFREWLLKGEPIDLDGLWALGLLGTLF